MISVVQWKFEDGESDLGLAFRELDDTTRKYMIKALDEDESNGLIVSKLMTDVGLAMLPSALRDSILRGDENTLASSMRDFEFWLPHDAAGKTVNALSSSKRLAMTEFSTMYTRGLCLRLKDDGVSKCRVYRAGYAKNPRCECASREGTLVDVDTLLANHRQYDSPGPRIPFGPNCHHSICRESDD